MSILDLESGEVLRTVSSSHPLATLMVSLTSLSPLATLIVGSQLSFLSFCFLISDSVGI
jgi:hypothetical protein